MIDEKELVAAYNKSNAETERLAKLLDEHFMPQARAAAECGDLDTVKALIRRCPDCVAKIFMMDILRQALLAKGA